MRTFKEMVESNEPLNEAKRKKKVVFDSENDKFGMVEEGKYLRIYAKIPLKGVKVGAMGGLIEKESNLSTSSNCWIAKGAMAIEDSSVIHDARIQGKSVIKGKAEIANKARVSGSAVVEGKAKIFNEAQFAGVKASGSCMIFGNADISGLVSVSGKAKISGDVRLMGKKTWTTDLSGDDVYMGEEKYN